MRKTLYFVIGFLIFSCVNKTEVKKKPTLAINLKLEPIEIEYTESAEKTTESLKKIWNCKYPLIFKSENNYNGKITNNIDLMITGIQSIETNKREENIRLTIDLIKNNISNYKDFIEINIITVSANSSGDKQTLSRRLKTIEL